MKRNGSGGLRWLPFLLILVAAFVTACSAGNDTGDVRLGRTQQAMAMVTTDMPSYTAPASVQVSWTATPGNVQDWVAIAPEGSVNEAYVAWVYTGGAIAGNYTFTNIGAGNYVARAFENNGFTLLAQSTAFSVTGGGPAATVTTDKPSYAPGASAIVSYTGAMGTASDWVSIAPVGSAVTEYPVWSYTPGTVDGQVTLSLAGLPLGNYVARLFNANGFALAAQSTTIVIQNPPVTTDKLTYATGESVMVSFTSFPGNPQDWIGISTQGSPPASYLVWKYTGGTASGTVTFDGLAPGNYVARGYYNNSLVLEHESVPFTIGAPSGAVVTTNMAAYTSGDTVQVSFTGATGSATDWVVIATQGSANGAYHYWTYTGGGAAGTVALPTTGLPAGNYVARLFSNNTLTLLDESDMFTIGGGPPM